MLVNAENIFHKKQQWLLEFTVAIRLQTVLASKKNHQIKQLQILKTSKHGLVEHD